MPVLLKIAPVRVCSIKIMQVRVQNKGKSVWKSRYDGDVSEGYIRTSERFRVIRVFFGVPESYGNSPGEVLGLHGP